MKETNVNCEIWDKSMRICFVISYREDDKKKEVINPVQEDSRHK